MRFTTKSNKTKQQQALTGRLATSILATNSKNQLKPLTRLATTFLANMLQKNNASH